MIWLVIGCIILYILIGFALNVLFRVKGIVDEYDNAAFFMTFMWPIASIVLLVEHYEFNLESLTDWVVESIKDKMEDDEK